MSGFREWAAFEPYIVRLDDGRASFANELHGPRPAGRPGSSVKLRRRKRLHRPWRHQRTSDQIERAAQLAAARRWIPANPLWVHLSAAEDAVLGRRGAVRQPLEIAHVLHSVAQPERIDSPARAEAA